MPETPSTPAKADSGAPSTAPAGSPTQKPGSSPISAEASATARPPGEPVDSTPVTSEIPKSEPTAKPSKATKVPSVEVEPTVTDANGTHVLTKDGEVHLSNFIVVACEDRSAHKWTATGGGGIGTGRNPTDALSSLVSGGTFDDDLVGKLSEAEMADEVPNNNVIQLYGVKKVWVARIGPVGRGIQCQGISPIDAVKGLTKMIEEARWTFDPTWTPLPESE